MDETLDGTAVAAPRAKGAMRVLQKDEAYRQVKRFLLEEDDGETIYSERFLSTTLDIGLASVRSAVERLRADGIVETIPKAGIRLPRITPTEVNDFYEVRMVLEPYVARRITGRLGAADAARLDRIIAEQRQAAAVRDTVTYHVLDLRFHELLAEIHGNREIVRALGQMRDKMFRLSKRLHRAHPERLAPNAEQHAAIVAAICGGEADEAASAMSAHLSWGRSFTLDPHRRIA